MMVDEPTVKLLFVDDDEMILRLLKRVSTTLEAQTTFADGAAAALGLLEDGDYDIVVSDFSMPGMSGLSLLTIVAERWPKALRVLLTGHPREAFDDGSVDRVVDLVLAKPWHNAELHRQLELLIAQARTAPR